MTKNLTDRDIRVLELCSKYRVMKPQAIAALAGFSGAEYMKKVLRFLVQEGYLQRAKLYGGSDYIYSLSKKGLNHIGKTSDTYNLFNYNVMHEADISEIAAWLVICDGIDEHDIITDRQQRAAISKFSGEYFADIFIESTNTAWEYERSLKSIAKFEDKILGLSSKHERVVWVVPDKRQDIQTRIQNTANKVHQTEYGKNVSHDIITLEQIDTELIQKIERN